MLLILLSACGGIRYSEVAPEVKEIHPRTIGILPIDVGAYPDARDAIDKIVADVLLDKGWFATVVSGDAIKKQALASEEIRQAVSDYASKLKNLSYSDPGLSKKIGELLKIDAFLVVDLAYWNYTKADEDNIAKVEAAIAMINANTGQVLWNGHHYEAEKYTFFKPKLPDVARNLMKRMIGEMPH
jgi:hypothetical protein